MRRPAGRSLVQEVLGLLAPQDALARFSRLNDAFYRGVPDFEEFVQVVGKDPEKTKALNKGDPLVLAFLQHPFVKTKPADFPVDKLRSLQGHEVCILME